VEFALYFGSLGFLPSDESSMCFVTLFWWMGLGDQAKFEIKGGGVFENLFHGSKN
jgi:hypothetical protein